MTERENKIAEFDTCLRKKDESTILMENEMRQRVQGNDDDEINYFQEIYFISIYKFNFKTFSLSMEKPKKKRVL